MLWLLHTASHARGIHEEVDDGVEDGVGHGQPVEGQEDVLLKYRLDRWNSYGGKNLQKCFSDHILRNYRMG